MLRLLSVLVCFATLPLTKLHADPADKISDLRLFLTVVSSNSNAPTLRRYSNKGDTSYYVTVSKEFPDFGVRVDCDLDFDDSDVDRDIEEAFHQLEAKKLTLNTFLERLWNFKRIWPECSRHSLLQPRRD